MTQDAIAEWIEEGETQLAALGLEVEGDEDILGRALGLGRVDTGTIVPPTGVAAVPRGNNRIEEALNRFGAGSAGSSGKAQTTLVDMKNQQVCRVSLGCCELDACTSISYAPLGILCICMDKINAYRSRCLGAKLQIQLETRPS